MRRLLAALGFMVFGEIAPGIIAPVSSAFAQEFELPALYGPQGALFPPAATAGWGGFYVGGQVGYSAAGANFANAVNDLSSFIMRDSVFAPIAAAWAHRNLPAKNTLTAPDAKIVEERFQARLSKICPQPIPDETSDGPVPGEPLDVPAGKPSLTGSNQSVAPSGRSDPGANQKSSTRAKKQSPIEVIRALGKTVRLRDKDHRRYVLRQACLVCGRVPSDPHHLTFTQPRALGRRVSDEFIVPVCRVHHRELHRSGNEAAWWQRLKIDPVPVALRLWQQTRSDDPIRPEARIEPKASTQGEAPD